jgi:hypothetical protein
VDSSSITITGFIFFGGFIFNACFIFNGVTFNVDSSQIFHLPNFISHGVILNGLIFKWRHPQWLSRDLSSMAINGFIFFGSMNLFSSGQWTYILRVTWFIFYGISRLLFIGLIFSGFILWIINGFIYMVSVGFF